MSSGLLATKHPHRVQEQYYQSGEKIAAGNADEAKAAAVNAITTLDKAAGKGIIHPNNAARRKARLVKKLNALRNSNNHSIWTEPISY